MTRRVCSGVLLAGIVTAGGLASPIFRGERSVTDLNAGYGQTGFALFGGHFDADGSLDLLLLGDPSMLLLNDGTGVFARVDSNLPRPDRYTKYFDVADLNGDGLTDLISATHFSGGPVPPRSFLRAHVNEGDASFRTEELVYHSFGPEMHDVSAADVDADGDADIVYAHAGSVVLLRNDGDGGFGAAALFDRGNGAIQQLELRDLDGDGDPDFIAQHQGRSDLDLAYNDGTGGFVRGERLETKEFVRFFVCGDVHGDGATDVALHEGDHAPRVYRNEGAGAFGFEQQLPGFSPCDAPGYRCLVGGADFDSDSLSDLVVTGEDSGFVVLRSLPGDGSVVDRVIETGGTTSPNNFVVGDFTGDGHDDIATSRFRYEALLFVNRTGYSAACDKADFARPFGVVDLADIEAFLTAFLGGESWADLDGNALLDLGDLVEFVIAFGTGC